MNLEEYTSAVERGEYPEDPLVPEGDSFHNENGVIRNLLFKSVRSVALISSKKGSIRSNHYHKTDWHYLYVLSGTVMYFWISLVDLNVPIKGPYRSFQTLTLRPFQMFFTPPGVVHAVLSMEDSELISLARLPRTHVEHETDLVRVKLVDRSVANVYLERYLA